MIVRAMVFVAALAGPAGAADFTSEPAEVKVPAGVLKGTLVVPAGKGPFPVAVMHPGSGPTDRDGNQPVGVKTDGLKMVAEALAAKGVATLRIDKRLIGESPKSAEKDLRFDHYVDDVVAWVELLRKDRRFDRVAFIGHSEGALIGLAAAGAAKFDAFVSLCGPGEPLAATLRTQLKKGLSKELYEASDKAIAELEAGREVKEYPKELVALFRPSVQPYLISLFKPDPAKLIAGVGVPVLIVGGSADVQIGPENAKKLAEANPKAKVVTVEKMNHTLKTVDGPADQKAAYTDPARPLAPGLVPALAEFLTKGR
ncbi:MAG TPA: alpha/beta hydrolase [Gemmataceae bacterium]|jgi:pimeloyl-ACP methyl ester carboxylesterase|nr:alpha/beta hydrolase [Gemmataceae bacterium]